MEDLRLLLSVLLLAALSLVFYAFGPALSRADMLAAMECLPQPCRACAARAPEAQGSLPGVWQLHLYERRTRASLGRAVRTAYCVVHHRRSRG